MGKVCHLLGLNQGPSDLQSDALPTELKRQLPSGGLGPTTSEYAFHSSWLLSSVVEHRSRKPGVESSILSVAFFLLPVWQTRSRQDSNLRGQSPVDFWSTPLTAWVRLLHEEERVRHSIVVRTPGSHPGDPGSIPGGGTFALHLMPPSAGAKWYPATAGNRTRVESLGGIHHATRPRLLQQG